jgi:diguanylate cyclase (GGDEF)-like protein
MRRAPIALLSGIGRRVVWTVVVCGLVVLALGLLLQAGKQQRQYREFHQQQLRQAAAQAALTVGSRLGDAGMLLRAHAENAAGLRTGEWALLRTRLLQLPMFEWAAIIESTDEADFRVGARQFRLSNDAREAVAAERTVLLAATDSANAGDLYLVRALPERAPARWVLVELRSSWIWYLLNRADPDTSLLAMDSAGQQLFSTLDRPSDIVTHVKSRLPTLPESGSVDLSWNELGKPWVGAMSSVGKAGAASDIEIAMLATGPDRPWSVAFWSALRTQSTMLPLLLLLAGWFAHVMAKHNAPALRQLRRALSQLPERRVAVNAHPDAAPEVRQLVDSFNRSAEIIEAQAETRRALDEIDGLLLPGGDYENVIDQVLTRVRSITQANNVGLTLIDPGVSGHGRLFVVNGDGGCPVNRVVLDEQMVATLRDARQGLTVVRCEEGRHSFLEPLQAAGSGFFWVWPVTVGDELAAILAVGYFEPPVQAARVAGCGTHCAQRLGISLSGNARAERLYRQAHFDPLTQLPNRLLFRDQLAQELQNVAQNGARGALLYIDLDHFKKVNDSLGHEAGDQLLAIVAQRLRACVKDGDTVARLGGDEFTVILRNITDAAAVSAVADRIIQATQHPVRLGGRDHTVHASIGMTIFPVDGTELDALLHNADLAMYRAKDLGRGAAVFYNPKMATQGARVADSGLYRALKRREFSLYYQPQYSVTDGSMVGVEALVRWQKPRDGLVSSAAFIPAAEESGLIIDLGCWVIDAACAQIALWRELGLAVPRLAVNLSVQQLRDPELISSLRRMLDRHRVPPAAIEFEMNEAALTDPDSQTCIEALSALGVRLTLDDFGTGHTALANLRRYPVGAVKIDRSFVQELAESPSAAALASTIIVMAHSLDKQVIAEGVETIEQLDYLRERGCDLAQGYFMARPLSAKDMTEMLIGRNPQAEREHSAFA